MQSLALLTAASLVLIVACSEPMSRDEPLAIEEIAQGVRPSGEFDLSTILRVDGEEVLACSEEDLLESDPPECGVRQVPADLAFDVHEIPSLRTYADGVALTGPIVLHGAFEGETFVATAWSSEVP